MNIPSVMQDAIVPLLKELGSPILAAVRLLTTAGLERPIDVESAARRLGLEVEYVDFPVKAGGYALGEPGIRCILVNRLRDRNHQEYTLAHELGHHALHLKTLPIESASSFWSSEAMWNIEADCFATAWLLLTKRIQDIDEEFLKQNPEILNFVCILLIGILIFLLGLLLEFLVWALSQNGIREAICKILQLPADSTRVSQPATS
ncbi:MAG: ImmA/IrrE family metallo-endopeptidase [Nitrospiraceae bacterium]|nr:ImmA/IrrE family metallo-endopeptidase [Nitrospiraceae bacterium]